MTGPDHDAVEQTIRINARPETVWRYWTDPERICHWWGASAVLDPRPGGICLVRLGGDAVMRGEFVELIPYRRIVFTLGWEPADGGATRMTLRNRGEPAGFAKILAPLVAGAMRRANSKDLARLKSILEAP